MYFRFVFPQLVCECIYSNEYKPLRNRDLMQRIGKSDYENRK